MVNDTKFQDNNKKVKINLYISKKVKKKWHNYNLIFFFNKKNKYYSMK